MKAVLQYRATPGFRAAISAIENEQLRIAVVDETDKETFAREIRDAEVLLHVLERVTAAVFEQAPRLKLIQKLGVGVDTIDLDAARSRGVAVCNMPGANTRAVAELTLLLMLATSGGCQSSTGRPARERDGRLIRSSSTISESWAAVRSGSLDSAQSENVSRRCCRG